jgi:3-deoxy-D-manno-octulosonic-acid transferase
MRFFYNLLTYLLFIPFAVYWLIRGIVNREYFDRLNQRFGYGFPRIDGCIWIHAVSVGEVQAAEPLIRALAERFPGLPADHCWLQRLRRQALHACAHCSASLCSTALYRLSFRTP